MEGHGRKVEPMQASIKENRLWKRPTHVCVLQGKKTWDQEMI